MTIGSGSAFWWRRKFRNKTGCGRRSPLSRGGVRAFQSQSVLRKRSVHMQIAVLLGSFVSQTSRFGTPTRRSSTKCRLAGPAQRPIMLIRSLSLYG
jgi:hypothetical protein